MFEFDHEKVDPVGVVAKAEAGTDDPAQTVTGVTGVMTGTGFTVMVKVCGVPVQLPMVGVTVMVETIGAPVAFVVV